MFIAEEDIPKETMEVILTCVDGQEYVYWVSVKNLPNDYDEYDWSIEQARTFHSKRRLPECPEDTDQDCYAEALEPFPRNEHEFTWIR